MGGIFGVTSNRDCILDVFFGTDYHSHLGTRRGGMAAYDPKIGLQREIHNIENSPFRTKFEHVGAEMKGNAASKTNKLMNVGGASLNTPSQKLNFWQKLAILFGGNG